MNDHDLIVQLKEHREALRTAVRAALTVLSKDQSSNGCICELLRSSLTYTEKDK